MHTGSFVVVDIDALQLQIGVAMVGASRVNTVLIRYHLPELHIHMRSALTLKL